MEPSYQVIARKYRPQRFSDVVGQEHVTQTLANAIKQNRVAHAFLFVGPRGTGKTTIARIFAKCLNCANGPSVDFSDDDPRCREITEGRSLDVLEIDGASKRGIDEIRELLDTVQYSPSSSRFKIYIIDEVHMLTKEAFNALLKTLEEPPAHVKFMFATTEPEKVLATILSRCQRFDLRRISNALIVRHLAYIAGREKVKIDAEALVAIARGADGGLRDAESTLDQLISFCGDTIVEADVLAMFGLAAQRQILSLVDALLQGHAETALRELNSLAAGGKDLSRLLADLLGYFRNLLVFTVTDGNLGQDEISEAEAANIASHRGLATIEGLTRVMEILADCESRFRDASSRKILLEMTLLRVIEARNTVGLDTVLKQLQQLRSGQTSEVASAPTAITRPPLSAPAHRPPAPVTVPATLLREAAPVPAPSPAPAPVQAPAPTAAAAAPPADEAAPDSSNAPDLLPLWQQLIESVGRASPFTKSYLIEAHPVGFAKKVFTIGFDPEFADHLGLVDTARVHTLLHTKFGELGHTGVQIKFIKAPYPAGWRLQAAPAAQAAVAVAATPPPEPPPAPVSNGAPPPPKPASTTAPAAAPPPVAPAKPKTAPTPFNPNDCKNDPLIQKALQIFKGEIVEVRS